jgi:hypothetical protein
MRRAFAPLSRILLGIALFAAPSGPAFAGRAMRVQNAIWADDRLFGTVLTPTSFQAPPSHSLDLLYDFGMSGLQGQRSVAESAPGDPTYNGGRWWVQMVVFTESGKSTFDPDGDGLVNVELTSASAVLQQASLGHLEIIATNVFFECPLLKSNRP